MADRTDRSDRKERDRTDRDRTDRDRTDRDRTDRDRTDRERTDRDRTDRDRVDRPRTPPGEGREKTRYDYDKAPTGGEKTRYDYDKAAAGDKTSSAPRYDYDQAPGAATAYATTTAPPTKTRSDGGIAFAPVPVLTDAGYRPPPNQDPYHPQDPYRPQDPHAYPPPGSEIPYGRPPPQGQSASYPLPSQSSGLSSYPGPGAFPLPMSGANGTYYANNYQPPLESIPGPAASGSAVGSTFGAHPGQHGSQQQLNHINPAPLSSPGGGPLPLAATASQSQYWAPPLKVLHSRTESSVKEYVSLQRQRNMVLKHGGTKAELDAVENKLRSQAASALAELRVLRGEISEIITNAEGQRWRRWIMGGIFASFIPLVKKLFKRPREERARHMSRTEYAFLKSKSLVDRILHGTARPGIATVAFFVFAVLYIFSNEVSLQVSRTVAKRLRRLTARVESGDGDVGEEDLKALQGWRWRVLLLLD